MSEELQATIAEQAREIASKQANIDGMNEKHWEAVQELAALKQPISDEREAFEAWRLANFCGGAERLKKCSNAPDVYYYAAEQEAWKVWQARARLGNAVVMPEREWLQDGGLIYSLENGVNHYEINVTQAAGSRQTVDREWLAARILDLLSGASLNPSRGVPAHSADVSVPREFLLEAIAVLMLYTRGSASREGILINGIRALLNGGRS